MTKVLIVEDNEMNRDMLSRRLKRRGYEIETCLNGLLAIEYLATKQPNIILMDMRMPVMDGWEATEKIKADPKLSHIPIVGLSANAMEGDKDKALMSGCDDYATKPVNLDQLIEIIEKLSAKSA